MQCFVSCDGNVMPAESPCSNFMVTSNHERVGNALRLLKEGLGPFVKREVQTAWDRQRLSKETREKLLNSTPRPLWPTPNDLDVAGLFRLMKITWNDCFRSKLGQTECNLVYELSDYRNKWAHQENLSSDDIYRLLDSSERLLGTLSAPQTEAVKQLRSEQLLVLAEEQNESKGRKKASSAMENVAIKYTTAEQDSASAGESLLRILEGLEKSHGEELTTHAAEILLKQGLGLTDRQISKEFKCGARQKADFAASYINEEFDLNRKCPKILLELKSPNSNLHFHSGTYFKTVDQLKRYMNSIKCHDVEHGIIFNIRQIQLFRKHEKLIYPVTSLVNLQNLIGDDRLKTREDKIKRVNEIIAYLKKVLIEEPKAQERSRGTIITVWNNKGGVGKTTVTFFLSFLLSNSTSYHYDKERRRKILVIDFDHNQADLTNNFKCSLEEYSGKMLRLLENTNDTISKSFDQFKLKESIFCYMKDNVSIDLLAADTSLCDEKSGMIYGERFADNLSLRRLCLELVKNYDYVIIDAPPNYQQNIYAREALNAADCLLPIALWGDYNSFKNYYSVIYDLLPRSRDIRKDGGPENLGLWINRCKLVEEATMVRTLLHINGFIDNAEEEKQEELSRAFFSGQTNKGLRLIKESAHIRNANYLDAQRPIRIPWQKRPQDIYADLLASIIGEGK